MARIFTRRAGDKRMIGGFGEASHDVPAVVPAAVGRELEAVDFLRVEHDGPPVAVEAGEQSALTLPDAPEQPATPIVEAWHSVNGGPYHDSPECSTGNNIEPENRRPGKGGRKHCRECAAQKRGGE